MKKRICSIILTVILTIVSVTNSPVEVEAAGSYTITVGQSITIQADIPAAFKNVSGSWSCSNSYVRISPSGRSCRVTGVQSSNEGFAYVSYNYTYTKINSDNIYDGYDGFKIVVNDPVPTAISLSSESLSLKVGEDAKLTYTITPSNAKTTCTYHSSNPNVAKVDNFGKVTAQRAGNAIITIKTANDKTATCSVTVKESALTVSGTTPKNKAEVSRTQGITFTYNQEITKGNNFSCIILTDNTTGKDIAVTGKINGKVLIVTPVSEFDAGHSYKVTLPQGAIKSSGGTFTSSKEELSFTVKAVEFEMKMDDSENVELEETITIQCDDGVQKGKNWEKISLINKGTGKDVSCTVKLSGSVITIKPLKPLEYKNKYEIVIPAGAMTNEKGISQISDCIFAFSTKPGKIDVKKTEPENGTKDVLLDIVPSLTFNYNVIKGDNFNNIVLRNITSGQNVQGKVALTNNNSTFPSVPEETTADGSTLTFTPDKKLDFGNTYQLILPAGAVKNEIGEPNKDAFTLEFETISQDKAVIEPPEIELANDAVTITATEGASIYYTMDGEDPIANGILYTKPVSFPTLKGIIRAVAVKEGAVSKESKKEYKTMPPICKWSANFGGGGNDTYNAIETTKDGYIAVGYSDSSSFGNGDWEGITGKGSTDAIIVKYDLLGNVEWKKNFGGGNDYYNAVAVTGDGYIVAGYSISSSFESGDWENAIKKGGADAIIVKYDLLGNVEWKKRFGGSGYDYFKAVAVSEDGYVAVGYSDSSSLGNGDWEGIIGKGGGTDAIIVKYDRLGNVEWKKNLGGKEGGVYYYAVAVTGNGYLVAGQTGNYRVERENGAYSLMSGGIIVQYDKVGNLEEEHYSSCYYNAIETVEDGYVAAGCYKYQYSDVAVIEKYDISGQKQWENSYRGKGYNYTEYMSVMPSENGYVAVGYTESSRNNNRSRVIVGYDLLGNVKWKKDFGDFSNTCYNSITAIEDGCIVVGSSKADNFGKGDWEDIKGNGQDDAIIVKYSLKDSPTKNITPKPGTVSIYAKDKVIKGEKITADVFFQPTVTASAVNLVLTYPSCLTYTGKTSEYKSVYVTEEQEGEYKSLNISCDFTTDNPILQKETDCILASLEFTIDEKCEYGTYSLQPVLEKCFIIDEKYQQLAFEKAESQEFSVIATVAKQIFILGNKNISKSMQYQIAAFPKKAEEIDVEWSVSDPKVASIDEKGNLVPKKNGAITITACSESSGLKAELDVVVSGIGTYLNSLSANAGEFAKSYKKTDLERILYVPKDVENIQLTAEFEGGSLVSDEYGVMFNGIAKDIKIKELPTTIVLTKKENEHDDTVYKILICEKSSVEETPDIQIDYEKETLTGFAENVEYTIDGKSIAPVSGNLAIKEDMFGKTITIIRKGKEGATLDSEALELAISKRPAKPSGLVASYSVESQSGKITGVSTAMEYKKSNIDDWKTCTGTEITNLAAGTYQVRIKASKTSFASDIAEISVNVQGGEEPVKTITPTITPEIEIRVTPTPETGIKVTPVPTPEIKVTSTPAPNGKKAAKISITCISKRIAAGKRVTLKITTSKKSEKIPKVKWKSSNTKYASVTGNGIVKTKKAGAGKNVTIIATATDDSGLKAAIKLKLMKHSVTKVQIKKAPKTIKAGKTITLHTLVKTNGKNANKTLLWITSNHKYATVNTKGKVTAKKAGKGKTVTITARTTDGTNKKVSVKIKIR